MSQDLISHKKELHTKIDDLTLQLVKRVKDFHTNFNKEDGDMGNQDGLINAIAQRKSFEETFQTCSEI